MIKIVALKLLGLAGGIVILVCLAIRPLVRIEIGELAGARIGTLIETTEYWLRKTALRRQRETGAGKLRREFGIYVVQPKTIANRCAIEMLQRRLFIVGSRLAFHMYHAARSRWPDSPVWSGIGENGYEDHEVWSSSVARQILDFTPEEEERGRTLLRDIGVPDGEPFVCFAVRDSAYLNTIYPPEQQNPPRPKDFWRYQDYRDSDIESFRPAMEWLVSQGFWVLRMGAVVEQPIDWNQSKIIDYATRSRSEFGDLYLLSHCRYFIGDTAGIMAVPQLFDVPSALANYLPFRNRCRGGNSLLMPKKLRRAGDNRLITYREALGLGVLSFTFQQQFDKVEIEPVANSADEILAMVQELVARNRGTWREGPDDAMLRDRFWSIFPPDHTISAVPRDVGDRHYFGVPTSFLRLNAELIT